MTTAEIMSGLLLLAASASAVFVQTPLSGFEMDWSIESSKLLLTLKVKTTGWVGFGITSSGAMQGSDTVRVTGDGAVEDGHVLDDQVSPVADCRQDWTLVDRNVENGVTLVKIARLLDTHDQQDHPLIDDGVSNRIIVAYGDSKDYAYHSKNRAGMRLNFFNPKASAVSESTSSFDFLVYNPQNPSEAYTIPIKGNSGGVNTYIDYCMDIPADVAANPVHVTDVAPVITAGNELVVHHFVLYTSPYPCSKGGAEDRAVVWSYGGAGTGALHLPADVGLSLHGIKSLHNNVHYYNIDKKAGLLDRSGVRIHYTTKLRPHDLGVMGFGDQNIRMFGRSVVPSHDPLDSPDPLARYQFQCTIQDIGPGQSVTAFAAFQHMHRDGFAFFTKITDSKGILKKAIDTGFFRGDWQDMTTLPQAIKIEEGDQVTTDCIFNVKGAKGTLKFGLGSEDEMCLEWLYYYPRNSVLEKSCEYGSRGKLVKNEGLQASDLRRSFGNCTPGTVTAEPDTNLTTSLKTTHTLPGATASACSPPMLRIFGFISVVSICLMS